MACWSRVIVESHYSYAVNWSLSACASLFSVSKSTSWILFLQCDLELTFSLVSLIWAARYSPCPKLHMHLRFCALKRGCRLKVPQNLFLATLPKCITNTNRALAPAPSGSRLPANGTNRPRYSSDLLQGLNKRRQEDVVSRVRILSKFHPQIYRFINAS